jgi:hypothetical protein
MRWRIEAAVNLATFDEGKGQLFTWEACVCAAAKAPTHHGGAALAAAKFASAIPRQSRSFLQKKLSIMLP